MNLGLKLKMARNNCKFTQEEIAQKIFVSRQTISNWENDKSLPDIVSLIKLSDIYNISLDLLLKGDEKMIKHLDESTNIVKSNKKLIIAILINILIMIVGFIITQIFYTDNELLPIIFISIIMISSGVIFFNIIKMF
ncbi:MAG: helix-turn-helix transcriptional regulator [Tissierellia bacterium]|nr:helix-turn-helix transcriptional regulator [Tissierellia bacterium]